MARSFLYIAMVGALAVFETSRGLEPSRTTPKILSTVRIMRHCTALSI